MARYDTFTIQRAQRNAYEVLRRRFILNEKGEPIPGADGQPMKNPYYTDDQNITTPSRLIQETPFVNTTNIFQFNFAQNAPASTVLLNNVTLGLNQRAVVYGVQLLIGRGANANNREYFSNGFTVNDNSIYNSNFSIKFEVGTLVDVMPGQSFRDVPQAPTEAWDEMGMVLINPQRLLRGNLGTFVVNITLINPIAALPLTANLFLSMRLHIVLGQANA